MPSASRWWPARWRPRRWGTWRCRPALSQRWASSPVRCANWCAPVWSWRGSARPQLPGDPPPPRASRAHHPPTPPAPTSTTAHCEGPPRMRRQLPQPRELLELMQFKAPDLNARRRRLSAALTIEDLRAIAKRRTPRAAFDYTDGAAESELSLARARQAFADVEFNPGVLRDVSTVDTSREMLGGSSAMPF